MMKAAVFRQFGDVDVVQIEDIPKPDLGKGNLLIQVKAAALNPKDVLLRKGKFKRLSGSKFPKYVAFDFAGIVADANGNSHYKDGDPVFGMLNGWKSRCCAEYLVCQPNELFHLPKGASFEAASGIPLAAQTALQAMRDEAGLQAGQRILINGASGGVGTLAIQIARILGARITTTSSARNLDLCTSLGAHETWNYKTTDITRSTDRFDVFFDVFGNYSFRKVKHLLSPKGVYVSTVPQFEIIKDKAFNWFRSKKAQLVVVQSNSKDLEWLCQQVENGNIIPQIEAIFPLGQIRDAQLQIESKRSRGKVIVRI